MFSLEELSKSVAAFRSGAISLEEFENWFEDNSVGAYDVADLRVACIAVDAAFSEYYYDHLGQDALKVELANAIRPFAAQWEKLSPSLFLLKNESVSASTIVASGKTEVVSRKPPISETSSAQVPLVTSATRSLVQVAVPA